MAVSDQLGTPRMIIDQTGSLSGMKRHDYLPFGEEIPSDSTWRPIARGYAGDNVRQEFVGNRCLGSLFTEFLPPRDYLGGSFSRYISWRGAPSFGDRLLWPTIALIMILIGTRMSDDNGLKTSIGAVGERDYRLCVRGVGWLCFAYVLWGTFSGFVEYLSFLRVVRARRKFWRTGNRQRCALIPVHLNLSDFS